MKFYLQIEITRKGTHIELLRLFIDDIRLQTDFAWSHHIMYC